MANSWPLMSLREAGVTLIDCEHRTPPASSEGYPYIAIPQLKRGRLDLSDVRLIDAENYVEWTKKATPVPYDVILSRRCNPGETAFVPPGLECALGQNLVLLRASGSRVYPPFLRWLVRGQEWWNQVGKFINVGAVFDSLRCADVPKFELSIPPLEDQRAIARVLGAIDEKIELNRLLNETLKSTAQNLYKSWFVDFEPVLRKSMGNETGLPTRINDLFPDSLVETTSGPIPQGWSVETLAKVCDSVNSGGTPNTSTKEYWGGNIPWLSSGETRSSFIIGTEKFITPLGVKNSSTRLARAGATVIASAGQGHTRGQTSMLTFDSYINQSVISLVANQSRISDVFLYFDLERRYEEFRRVSDGHSSRGSLTSKLLGGLEIVVPNRVLVDEFERHAGPLVQRITTGLRESRELAALRDTLLPPLLAGELRVSEAEKQLEAV